MEYKDLTDEQRERVRACKTPEELVELAKNESVELSDEQLEQISGGAVWGSKGHCPKCGSTNHESWGPAHLRCKDCGDIFPA